MIVIVIILALFIILATVELILLECSRYKFNKYKISFKEALDLCDLPVITLYHKDNRYNFLLDTGSNRSHICKDYIGELDVVMDKEQSKVTGIEGNYIDVGQGIIKFRCKDKEMEDLFLVSDLTKAFDNVKTSYGVQLHGILGTSFFNKYKYVIDFNECIFYHKGK